jgi:hypothetical protein
VTLSRLQLVQSQTYDFRASQSTPQQQSKHCSISPTARCRSHWECLVLHTFAAIPFSQRRGVLGTTESDLEHASTVRNGGSFALLGTRLRFGRKMRGALGIIAHLDCLTLLDAVHHNRLDSAFAVDVLRARMLPALAFTGWRNRDVATTAKHVFILRFSPSG